MTFVRVLGLRDGRMVEFGRIQTDGLSLRCVPDTAMLREIAATPVVAGGLVIPPASPLAFLAALGGQYRSAYCQVTPPESA